MGFRFAFAAIAGLIAIGLYAQSGTAPASETAQAAEKRARDLVGRMTLEEKISEMQDVAPAIPRLDIPAYNWWNEALHGVARAGLATVFPQAIALAATWDTNLEHRIASEISTEARGKYNDAIAHDNHGRYRGLTFWSPNINIFRDPRWGRGQETYGEDPYLTAQMAMQFIRGMQGDNPKYFKTIATSKHYAVHSGPETLRHGFNVNVPAETLDNTYLYAFRQTVEQAHVDSIMCAYNAVDGVPACASDMLLKQKLRGDWHFPGYVVSDCDSVDDIYRGHHYAKDAAEASADALKAGTDLDCGRTYSHLAEAVKQGLVSEQEITRSVVRLFTARFELGMFDKPADVPFSKLGMKDVATAAHSQTALQAARESIVLLKNDHNFLPLHGPYKHIAVIGPTADDPDAMLGNYNGIPPHIVTPLAGIEHEFGSRAKVDFSLGATYVEGWSAPVPSNVLSPNQNGNQHGLRAQYFANANFSGAPVLSRVEPRPFLNWEMQEPALVHALPGKDFSVRWTGFLQVGEGGTYRLGTLRPECHTCGRVDSTKILLDGKLLLSDTALAGEQTFPKTVEAQLQAGRSYPITIEYTETGGGGGVQLVWTPPTDAALHQAGSMASNSDLVILCLGLNSRLEGEESPLHIPGFDGGDRTKLTLPEAQQNLLNAILQTHKPVVVVLVNGSAVAIPEAKQNANAIVEAWYGGQEAGTAVAETLSGKNNPGGRLPVTFYASVDDLPPFTDYSFKDRTYRFYEGPPMYPFGYGLSYSTFEYADAKRSNDEVSATVRNTSNRDGDEVAQLYLANADLSRPELRGFKRVHLKAGESMKLSFQVNPAELNGRVITVGGGLPSKEFNEGRFVVLKQ